MPNFISGPKMAPFFGEKSLSKGGWKNTPHSGYDPPYKSKCNFEFSDVLCKQSIGYCIKWSSKQKYIISKVKTP